MPKLGNFTEKYTLWAKFLAVIVDICDTSFMERHQKKNTNVNIDFELWVKALPELKRRKLSLSAFVEMALDDFIKRSTKQNERIADERNSTSQQPEADSQEALSRSESNQEAEKGGQSS